MGLTLTVLGCSGTYAGPDGACSGYLIRTANVTVLLDCGPGTLANLQRHIDLSELDAIVITHEHPDHWLDLPILRNVLKYVREIEGTPVYGTQGTLALADALMHELEATFDWTVITGGDVVNIGDLTLRFSITDHPVETLAVHMTSEGRSGAFSSDTGPGWSFESFGHPIDTALCEATLAVDEGSSLHMTGKEAGRTAAAASAGRLLLTHVVPGGDPDERVSAAAAVYDGPVEAVTIHQTYDI